MGGLIDLNMSRERPWIAPHQPAHLAMLPRCSQWSWFESSQLGCGRIGVAVPMTSCSPVVGQHQPFACALGIVNVLGASTLTTHRIGHILVFCILYIRYY